MRLTLWVLTFLLSTEAFAKRNSIAVDLAVGRPNASITNPNDSKAYYKGVVTKVDFIFPTINSKTFAANILAGVKYYNLKNTTTSTQQESAQHIGPGLGVELNWGPFVAGYQYHMILARHQAIGFISRELTYSMNQSHIYGGMIFQMNSLGIGATIGMNTSEVPVTATSFSSASPYSDTVIWIHLRYRFNLPVGKFFSNLFK